MGLFRRDEDDQHEARLRVALVVAVAAHVERNTPQVFPKATTDRLEDAADELLADAPISFETYAAVKRIRQSVAARHPDRPWADALRDALDDLDLEALRP